MFGPQGGVWILTLLAVLTQYELYSLLEKIGLSPQKRLGCLFGLLMLLGGWYIPQFTHLQITGVVSDIFTISVIIISLTLISRPDFTETKNNIMPTLLGMILVPFMLGFYIRIFNHYELIEAPVSGLVISLWLIAVAKFTDVGGLLVGTLIGRHKLAKAISPGKTWEGAFGGILVAMGVGIGLVLLFQKYDLIPESFTVLVAGLFAIPIGVISIASDLLESVIKRKAGVKDSGKMIPGIGGAFDLTDSLLLSAPCGYLLFKYFVF